MTATHEQVAHALAWLERNGSAKRREEMVSRYGITAHKAFGVSMSSMQKLAKQLGKDHALAAALWDTGWYEARMLAAFVDEPDRVTAAQMDRWARDFDSWAVCDTLCFHLFDRSRHAWPKIEQWSRNRHEFVKRAAFALLACVALHDKTISDEKFVASLLLVERGAPDERHFVKKSVSWALRAIGERSAVAKAAALTTAERLLISPDASARWVGRDALKALTRANTRRATPARKS
ncbi:MAG: DNA alkylation repair protein [bacterium]